MKETRSAKMKRLAFENFNLTCQTVTQKAQIDRLEWDSRARVDKQLRDAVDIAALNRALADERDARKLIERVADGLRHQRDDLEDENNKLADEIVRSHAKIVELEDSEEPRYRADLYRIEYDPYRRVFVQSRDVTKGDVITLKGVNLDDRFEVELKRVGSKPMVFEVPRSGNYVIHGVFSPSGLQWAQELIFGIKPPASWSEWCAVWGIPASRPAPGGAKSTGRQSRANA